jgi:hypothetical protein
VKMRRESPRFRVLLDAHAVLHQANRERDAKGRIVATLDDYEAVKRLMDPFVGTASEQGVKEQVRTTVEEAAAIVADREDKSFTVKELEAALKKDNGSTNRRIRAAHPYIVELDEKRGRSKLYGLGDELPLKVDALPTADELCKSATGSSPREEGGPGTESGAEGSAEFGADFAQSSSDFRVSQTHKPPFNGEYGDEEAHEENSTGRGSIDVQSCRVRAEELLDGPNSVQSSPISANPRAEFAAWLSTQQHRDDAVGDLALVAATDPEKFAWDVEHDTAGRAALDRALKEWKDAV